VKDNIDHFGDGRLLDHFKLVSPPKSGGLLGGAAQFGGDVVLIVIESPAIIFFSEGGVQDFMHSVRQAEGVGDDTIEVQADYF